MLAATRIGAVVVPFSTFATPPELRCPACSTVTSVILLSCNHYRGARLPLRLAEALRRFASFDSFDPARCSTSSTALRHIVFDTER